MKRKILDAINVAFIPVLIILVWEFASQNGYVKVTLLPPPSQIIKKLWSLCLTGVLFKNILISLQRVVKGYLLGAFLGVGIGILMGLFPVVRKGLSFLTNLLRPIPMLAWIPVFILWLGIGETTKVCVIALAAFWPVLINVFDGISNVDKKYLEVSTIFCKRKLETVFQVIIPAALPSITTGLRLASGNALMGVVGAEMFAASAGIGFMISNAREMAQADKMFGGVLVIGVLGWILNLIVSKLNKKTQY